MFFTRCLFTPKSFMLPTTVSPVESARMFARLPISIWKLVSRSGEKTVRTAWLVFAAVLGRRLNMASTAGDCPGISAPKTCNCVYLKRMANVLQQYILKSIEGIADRVSAMPFSYCIGFLFGFWTLPKRSRQALTPIFAYELAPGHKKFSSSL